MLFRSCFKTTGAEYTRKRRLSTRKLNNIGTTDSWRLLGVGAGQKLSSAYRSNSLRAGTSGVHASTPLCMRACASCWLARRRTCVHEPRADMQAGEHACTSLVLTCTLASTRAQRRADLHRLRAGLHCRLLASRLAIRLEIRSGIS